jgi:hypothetical protein
LTFLPHPFFFHNHIQNFDIIRTLIPHLLSLLLIIWRHSAAENCGSKHGMWSGEPVKVFASELNEVITKKGQ